jgi:hypothetical protein
MTKIIAFAGRKQSGKTTGCECIANYINNNLPHLSHKIYSFADPLKQDICINILGLSYEECYGSDDDKNNITHLKWNDKQLTARDAMQIIGTEIFRSMYPNVWVNALINKIQRENVDVALISDCRFPNEVSIVKDNNGCVIRLTLDPFNSMHPSEKALDQSEYDWNNFDFVLNNNYLSIVEKNINIIEYINNFQVLTKI